jgi:hypothetical protein
MARRRYLGDESCAALEGDVLKRLRAVIRK